MMHQQAGRPVEHCAHKCVTHRHGTVTAYDTCACRCRACTEAVRRQQMEIRSAKRDGSWYPNLVPSGPIAEYIVALHNYGMSVDAMASVSGVATSIICRLVWPEGDVTKLRIRRDNAEALMAIRCGDRRIPGNLLVPAVGTRRRVEALARIGWGKKQIGDRLGVTAQAISCCIGLRKRGVTAARAHEVADLYSDLSARVGPSRLAERNAEAHGWPAPWQWDGVDIDDPQANPLPEVEDRGLASCAEEKIDRLADLLGTRSLTWGDAATHVGVSRRAIERWIRQTGRSDLAEAMTRADRRARGEVA